MPCYGRVFFGALHHVIHDRFTVQGSAYATSLSAFYIVLIPMMSAGTILYAISTALLTRSVRAEENGTIIGIDMGLTNLQRVVAPLLGTVLISTFGHASVGLFCAGFSLLGIFVQE